MQRLRPLCPALDACLIPDPRDRYPFGTPGAELLDLGFTLPKLQDDHFDSCIRKLSSHVLANEQRHGYHLLDTDG